MKHHSSLRRRIGALFLAVALLLTCTACGAKDDMTVVRLNEVTHSVFYAPLYAAMELGYFAEEGISIELTNGGGADKTMTAILSGQADIGLAGPEASIYVYLEGREDHPVVFSQLTKRDGSFLMAREPDPDFTWEKLRGKSVIGGRTGGVPLMALEYTLRQNGLTPGTDVDVMTHIQFNLMAGAFTSGTGDYVTIFEPTASDLEAQGKAYIVASMGEDSGEIPYTAFQASQSYLRDNPETAEAFCRVMQKALDFVHTATPEEIAEAIAPQFPDTSVELLAKVAQRYRDIDAWMSNGCMEEESFELLQTIMEEAGELSARAPYAELVNNEYAKKAAE